MSGNRSFPAAAEDAHAHDRPIDLTPVSARAAVGRYTGIEKATPRPPFWRTAGIAGLVALVAAAALPFAADALAVSG